MFITIEEFAVLMMAVILAFGIIAIALGAGELLFPGPPATCGYSPNPDACGYDANGSSLWERSQETPCPARSWHPPERWP